MLNLHLFFLLILRRFTKGGFLFVCNGFKESRPRKAGVWAWNHDAQEVLAVLFFFFAFIP